ncbi:MAG TPA: hypothetical protein VN838_06780 [Bradyrhizobium sp.]|nr:hypothetical protein [Bradyrhizobium sp.]
MATGIVRRVAKWEARMEKRHPIASTVVVIAVLYGAALWINWALPAGYAAFGGSP